MTHRTILVLLSWTVLCVSWTFAAPRPNVILVVTDDQGYGDMSCHGNPILKTPNIDRLYAESVRLADFHVAPTCSPTRCALQTGHWTDRTGVWHTIMGRSLLRANEVTMGQVFSASGYATGMFGKWHLGDNYPYRPEDRGYQEVMRHGGGGVGQTPDYWDNAYFDGSYFHNGKPEHVHGFCTDVWFRYATRFILAQKKAKRPFFAYIATNAPHGPMHSPTTYSKPYAQLGPHVASFYGMIANIDENLARLRALLRKEGLEENTILIFMTDNGTSTGDKIYNASMRGKKGSEYDGGHRVPCFFYWPKGHLTGGRDVVEITAHVDILPTLIDLCHLQPPAGVRFDGRSLRPLLESKASLKDGTWPDRILVTDSQRVIDPIKWRKTAVMTSRWRLVDNKELYEIHKDPSQRHNVADQHPEVVKRLRDFYDAWWAELEPTFKIDCPIYLGHPRDNPARLTCHDWIAKKITPWNQRMIRTAAAGPGINGYWNVRVVQDGQYDISLRRWPPEVHAAMTAGLPPGARVPGDRPFRAVAGKALPIERAMLSIQGQQLEKRVDPKAEQVTFHVHLKAGLAKLTARFATADKKEVGPFYAIVERKQD